MLGQIYKAKTQGLRIKPTYDDIIEETFKPVKVKYADRRAEATFNSHLFGQLRSAIDETENANQIARIKELGMRRAAAQSAQSFNSVAASIPPQPVASIPPQPAPSVPPQPAPSPIIVDYDLERERFLQEEAQAARAVVIEAITQRERTTQQAREQLQYIANENATARQMDQQRQSELRDAYVAELRDLQTRESNASWSLAVQERNAERALRR